MLLTERQLDGMLIMLGEPILHHGVTYSAVIGNEYVDAELGLVRLSSNTPVAMVKSTTAVQTGAPAPSVSRDDQITRQDDGAVFKVVAIKPTGQGLTELELVET